MHTVHATSISPGIDLTCIHTSKFKTGTLSVNLISGLKRDTAASSALLPRVLRRGSTELPDMELIASALDDLYGAGVEPIVRKKGELHCTGFHVDFPDESYLPDRVSVLEKTASLAGSILLSPIMEHDTLLADYVESEKKNLIDDIRSVINDKRGYATKRLLEEMCADEDFSISRLGSEDEAQSITPQSLTAHHRSQLAESKIELLYCGSADPERVEHTLRSAFRDLPEREFSYVPETNVVLSPPGGSPRKVTETLDVSQGKLAIGFRLGKDMKANLDYPATMVFNAV